MKLKKIKIKSVEFDNNIFLAPMAGFTDYAFRDICIKLGAAAGFTELVSCKGLLYNNNNSKQLLFTAENEKVKCAQIFGNDAAIMRSACESDYLKDFDIIDINMGCPMPKLCKAGEGNALMEDISKAENIIKECAKSNKPITVKFRTGVSESKKITADFAKMCEQAGAQMIAIHGRVRTAYYSGDVDFNEIENAKKSVKIPVIANGGVFNKEDAKILMDRTGADGIMVGRGALYNPFIFSELTDKKTEFDLKQLIILQIEKMKERLDDRYITVNLRKLIAFYIKGLAGSRAYKEKIFACQNTEQLKKTIAAFL